MLLKIVAPPPTAHTELQKSFIAALEIKWTCGKRVEGRETAFGLSLSPNTVASCVRPTRA